MKSIQVKEPGGPERMLLVDTPTPTPGPKQALVRIAFSGVNFIDVYFRTGFTKPICPSRWDPRRRARLKRSAPG